MASRDMLQWQYMVLLEELQQMQLHAADPTCPCTFAEEMEFCLPKHCLNVVSLAAETAAMDPPNAALLYELQEDAVAMHKVLKAGYCGEGEDTDVVTWSREWRKKVEPIYYTCTMHQPAITCSKEDVMSTQVLEQADPVLSEIASQVCGAGLCSTDSDLPICTAPQRKKLRSCVRKVQKKNVKAGCRPGGEGTAECPVPYAVCYTAIGCRPATRGRARLDVEQPPERLLEVCHA